MSNTVLTQQPAILARLRAETRSQHEAIERALMLMADPLPLHTYVHRLEQFYGFYKPVEDRICDDKGPLGTWLTPAKRRKAHLLEADLKVLRPEHATPVALCRHLPRLVSAADYFGCMYVLEGASLGGVLISRHIRTKLGVTAATGGRFFEGYAEHTGTMWQEFRAAITEFSLTTDDHDAVIKTACATFEALQSWCGVEPRL